MTSLKNTWIAWLVAALSFVGFGDATYLALKFYLGGPIPCAILDGCDTVTTSAYSTVGGWPIALFGALFYLAMLVLALSTVERERPRVHRLMLALSGLAFLFSLWLVYVQVFILESLCLYCLISAGISTLLFLLVGWIKLRTRRVATPTAPVPPSIQ